MLWVPVFQTRTHPTALHCLCPGRPLQLSTAGWREDGVRRSWLDLEVSQGLTLCGREKASASVVLPTLHARNSHALLPGRACGLPLGRDSGPQENVFRAMQLVQPCLHQALCRFLLLLCICCSPFSTPLWAQGGDLYGLLPPTPSSSGLEISSQWKTAARAWSIGGKSVGCPLAPSRPGHGRLWAPLVAHHSCGLPPPQTLASGSLSPPLAMYGVLVMWQPCAHH